MTMLSTQPPPAASAAPPVTPGDLAELMAAFNEVTARLEGTHESLRREVARLEAELREANEQLQRSRRLAALGEMAAGIAHEVRNPLGSIGLYAGMLEQDLADRPGERQTAVKIGAAVRGLDRVVGDVLSFAREVRVRRSPVEASSLFSAALEACAPAPGIRVARRDHERTDATVLDVDTGLAIQALVNIIRNALQAMEEAPPPPRGVHTLTLDAPCPAGWAVLSVGDTGPGVGRDVIDRMFNPFFTTRATGTGLGLAIVHRIVDAHGGRVAVRDHAPARGATFELQFPADRPTVQETRR